MLETLEDLAVEAVEKEVFDTEDLEWLSSVRNELNDMIEEYIDD